MSEFWENKTGISVVALLFASFLFSVLFSFMGAPTVFADNTISLTVSSNSVVLGVAPKSSDGTFAKSSNLNISVSLTGVGGYTLGIRSDAMGANATKLIHTVDNTKAFTSISSAISESDFASAANTQYNNTWGYLPSKFNSENNTLFRPAPGENGDILDYTEADNVSNNYTLAIGARADLNTTQGSYTGTFVITAVANLGCNSAATTIGEALCMQDLSGVNSDAIINSMQEGRQYQLKDNRDWKTYYVAKMKDGRVWMTQNLDLDLETTPTNVAALTHDNTDLGWTTLDATATWTPSTATAITAADYGSNTNTAPASFDYGEIYRYVDTAGTTTSYSTTAACETAHNDGTCPHYHVGNYYNWTAAIASNDSSANISNYTTAPNSICPAGWRLPNSKTSTTSTDLGYYSEINYTWINEGLAKNYVLSGTATFNPDSTTGWTNIRNAPMYVMAAGYKSGTSSVSGLGTYSYYWTNTAYNSTTAYAPYISSSGLYPAYYSSTYSARGRGLSVRCVARQVDTGSTIVTFDKNATDATGTTGTNNTQTISANTLTNLVSNGFSRNGYVFNSWNTKADGSGDSYSDTAQYYAKAGTTTNSVTLYAIWDKLYAITFNVGSGARNIHFDGKDYTNGKTVQAIEGKSYAISGNYSTGYAFNSWNVTAGTLENSNAAATNYTVTGDATITLTGQQATVDMTTLTNSGTPSANCKNEPVSPQLVYDPRDNEAYWVAQLCDGNIWMLDNLRLDLTNSTVINNLSSSNTNATTTQLNYLKNGGGTTSDQYPTAGLTGSNWSSSHSYSAPLVNISGTSTAGLRDNTWTGSYTKDTIAPVVYGVGSGKIGAYYNYCAASAGSYCWGNGTSNTGSPNADPTPDSYRDIEGDICPIGWHLPSSNTSNNIVTDYGTLYAAYNGADSGQDIMFRNALSLPLSGLYDHLTPSGTSAQYQGESGEFWSSTWERSDLMYFAVSSSTGANLTHSIDTYSNPHVFRRDQGRPIRCVFGGKTTVVFNKNANDATGTMDNIIVTGGTWAKIMNAYSRTGYVFAGWNTEADGSGTSYSDVYTAEKNITTNVTLFAQWDKVWTITFGVGSGASSISFDGTTYTNGQTVQAIEGKSYVIGGNYPTKYAFSSWNITAGTLENSNAAATNYTVTGDATITLTGQQATVDMTTLTNSGTPSANCKNEPVSPQLVYDPRDNEAYWVAQLCDGNIWMLDNLRLDLTNSTVINNLSSSNTNATTTQLNYLKNGGGTTSDQYPTAGLTGSNWSSSHSYSAPLVNISGTSTAGLRDNTWTGSYTKDTIAPVVYGVGSGKIGAYYNYCAASAGSYCWGNGTSNTGSPNADPTPDSYRDIEGDICPIGWHLPSSINNNTATDYGALYAAYSGADLGQNIAFKDALSTPLTGYFKDSGLGGLGTYDDFFSSTWRATLDMYHIVIGKNTYVIFQYGTNRDSGVSIRCMLDNI